MSDVKRYMVHWPAHDGDLVDAVKASDYDAAIAAKDAEIERLKARIAALEAALREITATTYGSELSMSQEEYNEYFAQFYSQYRDIARAALAIAETEV